MPWSSETLTLPDGSTVQIDYEITHDGKRSAVLELGDLRLRAIGTSERDAKERLLEKLAAKLEER